MRIPTPAPVAFLLVDDLEENLLALEALLRRDGLVLLKARSGPEALELLLKHDVALALVDVQMPDMDGFELAELMRGTERTRRVPIIFLTAGTPDRQRRFRGYEAGAVDFLTKPIETHVLRSKADVFFELWRERQEVARQRDELQLATAENTRLLEETRKTAESLKEADRRKDEYIALLAHELRNPLAPLRNGIEVLRVCRPGNETFDRTLGMIERQLGHMVHMVDDLLDAARVATGKVALRCERIDLRDVISTAIETSRQLIDAGGHELVVRVPDAPLPMDADRTRLSQVVANLLNNAAKYTPPGGRITLSAEPAGREVVVRVADTGVGIPAEMLPRVFDLFTQVGASLDRAQGGLGIGLTLVKRLVEMHGGTVTAHSGGAGRGSEFVVRLPLAAAVPTPPPAPSPVTGPAPTPGLKVLVVDDNRDAADSLAELLELSGHEVRTAHNGPAALQILQGFSPHAILLDLGLPGMSGYEVAAAIRSRPDLHAVKLVALTGWGQEEDRRRTREAGFHMHLVKPANPTAVAKILETVPAIT